MAIVHILERLLVGLSNAKIDNKGQAHPMFRLIGNIMIDLLAHLPKLVQCW